MIPNILSFIRIPFGIAFFWFGGPLRVALSIGAAISDGLDGYLARRWAITSKLGTILDPVGDKFFALAAFGSLYLEGSLPLPLFLSLFSREGALLLFYLYLIMRRRWKNYEIAPFLLGKVMTFCQFFLLFALVLAIPVSPLWSFLFVGLGFLSLCNLVIRGIDLKNL